METLPYEKAGARPCLFPGDIVQWDGLAAMVTDAHVTIDGTIYHWNDRLPFSRTNANPPAYLVTFMDADASKGVSRRWLNAYQLTLVSHGFFWYNRADLHGSL